MCIVGKAAYRRYLTDDARSPARFQVDLKVRNISDLKWGSQYSPCTWYPGGYRGFDEPLGSIILNECKAGNAQADFASDTLPARLFVWLYLTDHTMSCIRTYARNCIVRMHCRLESFDSEKKSTIQTNRKALCVTMRMLLSKRFGFNL